MRYCRFLYVALDWGTFEKEYPYDEIARDITPYWEKVRIQLGVKHQKNTKLTNDPTGRKFEKMLQRWLRQQTCSKREIYMKIYDAMIDVEFIQTAEDFKKKAL